MTLKEWILEKEPVVAAAVTTAAGIAITFALTGAFDDGVSAQEWGAIAAPFIAMLPARQAVDSPKTVQRRVNGARGH